MLSREVLDAVERPRSDRLFAAIELSLQRGGAGTAGDQRTVQVSAGGGGAFKGVLNAVLDSSSCV